MRDRKVVWATPTDIAEYSICPWKVYYRRVLGVYTEATGPLAVGWMEHEAWRRFYAYFDPANMTEPALKLVASRSAYEALDWALIGFDHHPSSLRSHVPKLEVILSEEASRIVAKLNNGTTDLALPLSTEVWLSSSELGIRGRADLVYESNDGYQPWDIKTGRPPVELLDSYKLQVAAYALLLESNYKCQVKRGGLRFTGLGIDESFLIIPELRREVVEIADSIRNMLLTGAHPRTERLSLSHCRDCGFKQTCREFVQEARGD